MENQIRHEGIVESVSGSVVKVRILQASACAGCKVASRCQTAEAKEKLIDVAVDEATAAQWHTGQPVVVTTQRDMARKALLIGFGQPLMLMMAVLGIALAARCSEGLAALLMLASLVPYYLAVWLLRDKISRKISFRIEEAGDEEEQTI